ncbi:nectin-3-like [Oncorhynchus clarkii lewisi]|uniref:nectin-3-like n=1 Tax=Oncorhynchus clarkii lewisi TaxID=490388 RepID=UPI0039B93EA7
MLLKLCCVILLIIQRDTEIPPVVSVTVDVPPVVGEKEVILATCVAAGAKPQADVKWKTGTLGSLLKTVTNSTQHTNGTTTVLSQLLGVPTRAANQQQVQCVVNQSALATENSFNYTIDIHYPPQTVNITLSETSQTSALCVADGNPQPNYTLSREGQPWPGSSVRAERDTLILLSLSSELNGLYVCEASNPYGRATGSIYVNTSSETSAATFCSLSLLLLLHFYEFTTCRHHHGRAMPSLMVTLPEENNTSGVST